MKFEVRYPTGPAHEVTLQGTVAVIGRDPSCELVVSDPKCSRRHAVLEAGPQGITIRDAGSANGVFVNDKKVDRSQLKEGDLVRLGDVVLKVLPEEMPGTLMMGPEEMEATPAPAPDSGRPAAPVPEPSRPAKAAARPSGPDAPRARPEPRPRPASSVSTATRPLTVTLLAVLWLLSIPLYGFGGVWTAHALGWRGPWAAGPIGLGLLLASWSGLMAYGLWVTAPWARVLQIVVAALGLFLCPFTLASAAVLMYMARPAARAAFTRPRPGRGAAGADKSEGAFAAVVLGTVLLGVAASGGALAMTRRGGTMEQARRSANEEAAAARLRTLAAAEGQFQAATCVNAYADLDGLLRPATAIPDYPPDGPAFLPPEFGRPEAVGYRFALTVEDPVPPTEGCAARGYRRFAYAAQPLDGGGRYLVVGPDGDVRAAEGRPATRDDPAVR